MWWGYEESSQAFALFLYKLGLLSSLFLGWLMSTENNWTKFREFLIVLLLSLNFSNLEIDSFGYINTEDNQQTIIKLCENNLMEFEKI